MIYKGQQFTFQTDRLLDDTDQGGMGRVYQGHRQDDPSIHVAIKVPLPDYTATFLREAEAAQRVADSSYVVPVMDWGDHPSPFIAFRFINGPTLRKVLEHRRAHNEFWSEVELIGLFHQLVDAMKVINIRVVHRDLKPENIFDDAGSLRVGDFGMSKYVGDVTRDDTHKGGGTGPYMAPEVWVFDDGRTDAVIDWPADQYSLGIVFYEMATLQRPFSGTDRDLRKGHLFTRPARVTEIVASLPNRLASLIARMIEKEVGDRFASWDEITAELDTITKQRTMVVRDEFAADLSRQVAAQSDKIRGRTLDQQRREDVRREKAQERLDLLGYWSTKIFEHLRQRVEGVKWELGKADLFFDFGPPDGSPRRCKVGFANTEVQIAVELDVVPVWLPDPPSPMPDLRPGTHHIRISSPEPPYDIPLWGIIHLSTPRGGDAFNVLLIEDTSPYGVWSEVTMTQEGPFRFGYTPPDFRDDEQQGRRYRVVTKNQSAMAPSPADVVIALTWKALYERRPFPREPGVSYHLRTEVELYFHESRLDFEGRLDELLRALVAQATA